VGGSGYFDGSGDYLITPTDTAFNFGTGDFTIEFWVYLTNSSATTQTIMGVDLSASTNSIQVWYNNTANKITFNVYGYPTFVSTSTVSINNWIHLAFTRSSGTFKMFINGVQEASGSMANNFANNVFVVGRGYATINAEYFYGYLSNLRVVKGTAVYTSAFTPPTAPLTAIANTSLLLNFTNAGIIDNTMINNIETVGDAKISTTQSKFGGSSMAFDGTGDYLLIADNQFYNFGKDFTIEFWMYANSLSGTIGLFGKRASESNFSPLIVEIASGVLKLYISTDGASWAVSGLSTATLSTATWYHIAMVRSGSTVYLFVNGTSVGSTGTASGALMTNAASVTIGRDSLSPTACVDFNGYLDDFRITRGYARYTANFTPPTAALPTQ
jgi:hypothetical protein